MPKLALHWQIAIGMLAGAVLGVALNIGAGSATTSLTTDLPAGFATMTVTDTVDGMVIESLDEQGHGERIEIGPAAIGETRFDSVADLKTARPELAALLGRVRQAPATVWGERFQRLGSLFLRMLKMVAVPLVVTSLASGVMGLGGAAHLGRMFSRTLLFYFTTTGLAIITGLVATNLVRPGLGGAPRHVEQVEGVGGGDELADVLFSQVENLIPANPFAALVEPNFLSIIAFTIAFAIFALHVGGAAADRVRRTADTGFAVMMAMTHAIIRLAPIGVFFLVAATTATQGVGVFVSLSAYMFTVAIALAVHACITLPLIVRFVARRSPWQFARAMSPALLTALSSASSNGTLPLTMECVEQRGGVRNRVGSFVLPLVATVNMDGTALYEAVAVLFIAQMHFGHDLPLAQQLVVCVTALLASVGAAGIPHAGLVMMAIVLQAVGLPAESQGIILAVDRVLDMARTAVNVWSDSCGAAVIDALEGPDAPTQQPT